MSIGFVLLAGGAAFYVFSDIGCEARPPEFSGDQLAGFKVPGVSRSFVVVTACEDGMTDGVIIRNIYAAFVGEDTGFMLPVREAGTEGEGNGSVHRLEGLEYKGVIGGGGLDVVSEGGVDNANEEGRWE